METGRAMDRGSAQSESYGFAEAAWTPSSPPARTRSPSQSARLSSLAYPETFHYGLRSWSRRFSPLAPLPEPQLLRLRPTSLRTQDISYLLTGVFRNLYTAEVIGEDVSTSLIKARGSENALHEEFVDQLQQIRELYKQRLDEFEMLERHIIQACARASAEKERAMHQANVYDLEPIIKMPPEKTIFRWCVDNELLQKHHLICPDDYYKDTVPFCSAPEGNLAPGYLKLTFSCEKRSIAKKALTEKLEASCRKTRRRSEDESDHTVDSLTWDSSLKAKLRTKETAKKASPTKNKNWMNHLRMPQRQLERLLLARMESRNHFLKNPRFFPPNTSLGGRSLIFPPRKAATTGEFPRGEPGQRCMDTPVFLAKPPIAFFTDYEIGSAYKLIIPKENSQCSGESWQTSFDPVIKFNINTNKAPVSYTRCDAPRGAHGLCGILTNSAQPQANREYTSHVRKQGELRSRHRLEESEKTWQPNATLGPGSDPRAEKGCWWANWRSARGFCGLVGILHQA